MTDVLRWPRREAAGPVAVLAHRGGTGPWRENTLEAFTGALAAGADGVELDVRQTADGHLVVHHDAEIDGFGALSALRARDLPAFVPGLDQALAACAGATVNVEVKNSPVETGFEPPAAVAGAVEAAITAADVGRGGPSRVLVSSFWPANLEAFRAAGSTIPLGLLVHPSLDAAEAAERADRLGCAALHPFGAQVDARLVAAVHDRDMAVVAWTVNDPADVATLASLGVDVVISDAVAATRRALGRL